MSDEFGRSASLSFNNKEPERIIEQVFAKSKIQILLIVLNCT